MKKKNFPTLNSEELKNTTASLDYEKPSARVIGGVAVPGGCGVGDYNTASEGCYSGDFNTGIGGCMNGNSNCVAREDESNGGS